MEGEGVGHMPSSSKPTKRPQGKGPRLLVGVALGVALAGLLVSGLAYPLLPREQDAIGEEKSAANQVVWPDYVASAPLVVRQAYQFALDNPEVLSFIPCYCGCTSEGHTSNEHCFVRSRSSSGVVFDRHGAG